MSAEYAYKETAGKERVDGSGAGCCSNLVLSDQIFISL